MENKKLAIFDFCGTIFKLQSPDMFADFVADNNRRTRLLQFVCNKLVKSPKYNGLPHKRVKLYKIKGKSANELKEKAAYFVEHIILKNLIPEVTTELDKYIQDPTFDVAVASAGYNTYLEYFCAIKNIPYLTATNIELRNNIATGKIDGADCYGQNKVTRLKAILNMDKYDLNNSVCFSDSLTDRPIFDLVGNKFFVTKEADKYSITRI